MSQSAFGRVGEFIWGGPPGMQPSLSLEWRVTLCRWIGILCVAPGLRLAGLGPSQIGPAYAVLVAGLVYNVTVQILIIRFPTVIKPGNLTSLGDALLCIVMLIVVGGFDTPLSYMLFAVTIAMAMRYGYLQAIVVATLFVVADALDKVVGNHEFGAAFFFRSGFLYMTAVLAGYLREQARRAEVALEERLRQANLLNDATSQLSASLELETILTAVTSAAARVFRSPSVVLYRGDSPEDIAVGPQFVSHPEVPDSSTVMILRSLCRRYMTTQDGLSSDEPYSVETLSEDSRVVIVTVRSSSRSSPLATLAIILPPGAGTPDLDRDILDSFLKRVTLAIENATFYRTMTHRTADLQRAYVDLEQAHQDLLHVDEMKTDFLANVSHEFRTPLTSIRSFSELLLTYDESVETRQEFVGIINRESERLTRMVNDVLDITKIESGSMDWNMQVVDLGRLVEDSAQSSRPMVESQNLYLDVQVDPGPLLVHGDRDRLSQVIGNLLNNAAKFTRDGGVTLRAARVDDEVVVTVTDTGIGIDQPDHERIFEKFQQVGAVLTNKPRGTGLGLPICREIVEFHEGQLWLESRLGTGSTFGFSLPAQVGLEREVVESTRQLEAAHV